MTGDGAWGDGAVLSSCPSRFPSRSLRAFLGGVECSVACDMLMRPACALRKTSEKETLAP